MARWSQIVESLKHNQLLLKTTGVKLWVYKLLTVWTTSTLKLAIWSFTKNNTGQQKDTSRPGFKAEHVESCSQPEHTFQDAHSFPPDHFFFNKSLIHPLNINQTLNISLKPLFLVYNIHFPPPFHFFLERCNSQLLAMALLNVCSTPHKAEVCSCTGPTTPALFLTGDSPETHIIPPWAPWPLLVKSSWNEQ